VYWLKTLGRTPDLDKWMLRPTAWCPACHQHVAALQVFKDPRCDMGRYGRYGQYWYRCPHRTCRHTIIEPGVPAAAEAIDWTLPAVKIGERVDSKGRPDPLAPATIARIQGGIARHYGTMLVPAGGTWRTHATPVQAPMPARTTRESDGLAIAPAAFIMRNNGSKRDGREHCTPVTEPIRTQATTGHQSLVTWDLLVPYYSHGHAQPTALPMGALSTRDRYALACGGHPGTDINDVRFRMLATNEIAAAMGFATGYIVLGTVKQRTRQLGQAITPCLGEAAYSALVETISGEELRARRMSPRQIPPRSSWPCAFTAGVAPPPPCPIPRRRPRSASSSQ
jgi:DNA (cytosine-5)-methyltransferase 1